MGTSENSTAFTTGADFWWNPFGIQTVRDDFLNYPSYVNVVADKISGTEVPIVILNYQEDSSSPVLMWNATFTVSAGWFAHNNLTLSVYHDGYGVFCGGMSDEIYTSPFSPDFDNTVGISPFGIWDFIDNLIGGAVNALPTWLKDQIGLLGGWFTQFVCILPSLLGFVSVIIPVLPYFVLFWVIDAATTSLSEGSNQPLGVCFSSIISISSSVAGVLVSIIHTIYSFIHFW